MDNNDEEERQLEDEQEQDLDNIFQLFFQITKPLVLELPSPQDRALAASWLQKLEAEEDKRLRVDYLKLLLFAMQRGSLMGIFKKEPSAEPLEPFPKGFGLTEMGNLLLEQAEAQGSGDADGKKMAYSVEISNDLREFVAAQEIPDFGVQVYYAWSAEDPIHRWTSFDENKFPHHVREKIRQLKIIKSEERTNLKTGPFEGDKTGGSLRKSCDSTLYDTVKEKVKSPEEIQKSLERGYQSYTSLSPQRGSARDRFSEEDKMPSRRERPGKNDSPDTEISLTEIGASRVCWQDPDYVPGEDEGDFPGGMGGGCSMESVGERRSEYLCDRHGRKREAETSKRLQKCDDAGQDGPGRMNEPPCMAGPSRKNADEFHGKEIYSQRGRCGGEAILQEKPHCLSARGRQMNQAISQPSMKSRKTRCSAHDNQVPQEDKKCACKTMAKCSSVQTGIPCSCPCPRAEKETPSREMTCCKKKERTFVVDKPCSKVKTPCPDTSSRTKEQSCSAAGVAAKASPRKMEHPEGCTCYDDSRRHQIEHLSRIGYEKTPNKPCPQETNFQHQQYACPTSKGYEKHDKKTPQQSDGSNSCSKKGNPPWGAEIKRRVDAFNELCAQQNTQQAVSPGHCSRLKNQQDACKSGRPAQGDYPATGPGPYPGYQDPENGMCASPGRREEACADKKLEVAVKTNKLLPKYFEPLIDDDVTDCHNKGPSRNETYPCGNEIVPKSYRPPPSICVCGTGKQNLQQHQTPRKFLDELSSDSDEYPVDDGDGQDDVCINPDNNADDECPNDDNACEGNPEYSSSSENNAYQNFDFCDATDYPKLPSQIKPCQEQHFPEQQAPFFTPRPKQEYLCPDQTYTLSSRPKKAPDPNFLNPHQNQNPLAFATSTPANDMQPLPFSYSTVSSVPHLQRTRCNTGQMDSEEEEYLIGGGRTHSPYKENGSSRRKKTSQDPDCSRGTGSPGQQFITLADDNSNNASKMEQMNQSHLGNQSQGNFMDQQWMDQQMKAPSCHAKRTH